MKRKLLASLVTGLMIATVNGGTAYAADGATTPYSPNSGPVSEYSVNTLSPQQISDIREFYLSYGGDSNRLDSLFSKLESGISWDVFTPSARPASTREFLKDGLVVVVETYNDGSIAVSRSSDLKQAASTTRANSSVSPTSVTQCKVESSHYAVYYKDCYADVNLMGVIDLSFRLDAEKVVTKPYRITRYWGMGQWCLCSLENHRMERYAENQVRRSADVKIGIGPVEAGWVIWMDATFDHNGLKTNHN